MPGGHRCVKVKACHYRHLPPLAAIVFKHKSMNKTIPLPAKWPSPYHLEAALSVATLNRRNQSSSGRANAYHQSFSWCIAIRRLFSTVTLPAIFILNDIVPHEKCRQPLHRAVKQVNKRSASGNHWPVDDRRHPLAAVLLSADEDLPAVSKSSMQQAAPFTEMPPLRIGDQP